MINYPDAIKALGIDIYSSLPSSSYFIPDRELEAILEAHFKGLQLGTLPARTRSKLAKEQICLALGYPVPKSFRKTNPRFPGQDFDVYVQTSNNLQIWNEEVDAERRYILIRPNADGIVVRVRVVRGVDIAKFDTTGTLTSKFQARMESKTKSQLLSKYDASGIVEFLCDKPDLSQAKPLDPPSPETLYPISEIYKRLLPIVGSEHTIPHGYSDRNRGEEIHKAVCSALGYSEFLDDGTFPDVKNQLLEVKTQTSPTIDLGVHNPSMCSPVIVTAHHTYQANEVRYAIFDCTPIAGTTRFRVDALYLVSGHEFSTHFPLFQGKVENKKIQLPLPHDFFEVRPKQE